MRPNTAI